MSRTAKSLVAKILAVTWILLCVHVARTLPATAGERIGSAGAQAFSRMFRILVDAE